MPVTETINYKTYAIVKQIVTADQPGKIERFTVYRPNNGAKVGQTSNLTPAEQMVDEDLMTKP